MSTPCKHEFEAHTTPDPAGAKKKKLKFSYCSICGGFMTSGTLTPEQRTAIQASVAQLRAESPPKHRK